MFAFALVYDEDADPIADAFRRHRDLYGRSLAVAVTPDHLWRVDRLAGPTEAVTDAETAFADHGHAADCLASGGCGRDHRFEVLHRDPTSRILYIKWARTGECRSVPHLALKHLGPGVLFSTERYGDRYEWRILMPSDAKLGLLYDAIQAGRDEGVGFDLEQVTDETAWTAAHSGRPALPYAQYEAMRAAVERGYYETPREVTVEELAAELGVARSTLSYRLRRAEAELATSFVQAEG